MGLFEDFKNNNSTSKGGIYAEFQKSKQPQPSFISKATDTVKSVGTGFIDMFRNPGEAQKNYERQVLPDYYKGDSKIMKVATAPGTFIARNVLKGFSRLITPGLTPLTEDIGEIREVSKKGGIADKIAKGELPPEALNDFKVLKKTGIEIVGDTSQFVLSLYAGGKAPSIYKAGAPQGFRQAFTQAAFENAPVGALFGTAQVASDREMDTAKEVFTTIGLSTGIASVLSGIVSGTVPASKAVTNKVMALFEKAKVEAPKMKKLTVSSLTGTNNVPLNTPGTRFEKYNKSMGYEGYIPESELPVIEMGAKPKDTSGLPVIQMEAPKTKAVPGDIRYESIQNVATAIINEGKTSPTVIKEAQRLAPTTETNILRPEPKQVAPEGKTITPKLARDVEKAAIEARLVSRFEGLPESRVMDVKKQASDVVDLMDTDYEKAKRIAMGDEAPPGELRDGTVFEAVKKRAEAEGDADTLRRLATESTIPSRATALGQEIKAFDTLNDSIDPVELMQSVVKSREKGVSVKRKGETKGAVKELRKEIAKSRPTRQNWNDFINSIEC